MIDIVLLPENTVVTAKGDSTSVDISAAAHRVFLVTLSLTELVEQESFELGVYGSADGTEWNAKPIVALPQKFYAGEYPLLVDVSGQPEIKFVRAHWDVNRWGRGPETPSFKVSASLKEVPAEMLREAAQRR